LGSLGLAKAAADSRLSLISRLETLSKEAWLGFAFGSDSDFLDKVPHVQALPLALWHNSLIEQRLDVFVIDGDSQGLHGSLKLAHVKSTVALHVKFPQLAWQVDASIADLLCESS